MSRVTGSRDSRQVSCRGLIIQVKGAGYDQSHRYEEIIKIYIG